MEIRDRRRWGLADENGDGSLTKIEFKHFLHPEEVDHMKDLVVQETIDDIDKVGRYCNQSINYKHRKETFFKIYSHKNCLKYFISICRMVMVNLV